MTQVSDLNTSLKQLDDVDASASQQQITNTTEKTSNSKKDLNNNEDTVNFAPNKNEDKNNPENELIDLIESNLNLADDKNKPMKKMFEPMDISGAAKYLLKCKNVIFMTGAGISTSAGIPDFRSPKTGLYANLSKYNLPFPEAVFSIDYFLKNPRPFYALSRELMPKNYKPTVAHYFQRLLLEKGHVYKIYTQNIDALETVANIPDDKLIAAHGSFSKGHCLSCSKEYDLEWMKNEIQTKEILKCQNEACLASSRSDKYKIVKPDITFFGESLPEEFYSNYKTDFIKCDLLIVMGTSLLVQPFGHLHSIVNDDCPRILINRELVGDFVDSILINKDENYRDVYIKGNIDDACREFAKHLGMAEELEDLIKSEHERLDELNKEQS